MTVTNAQTVSTSGCRGLTADVRLEDGTALNLTCTADLTGLDEVFATLRKGPFATTFNSLPWLEAWMQAGVTGEHPCIVLARHDDGRPAFLWPMSLHRTLATETLGWLGQSTFAVNLGCYEPELAQRLTGDDMRAIFLALRTAGLRFDAIHLLNQPEHWSGVPNPMLALAHQPAPNANYERRLDRDYDTLYRQTFSSRERRNHARQRRRLADHGTVETCVAETPQDKHQILDAFFAFKAAQLKSIGAPNPFERPGVQAFYRDVLVGDGDTQAELSGLRLDGAWVATLIGVRDGNRFTTLMSAITLDDTSKASPGQHLLEILIRKLCDEGVETFDFGPGPSPQKRRWEMQPHPMFDTYVALNARAWPATRLVAEKSRILHRLKRNEKVFRYLTHLRARISGHPV